MPPIRCALSAGLCAVVLCSPLRSPAGAQIAVETEGLPAAGASDAAPATSSQRDEIARLHFQAANAHFETGDYVRAAEEFQQAYDLSPRPSLLYNLALSYERLARLGPAIEAMERYLAGTDTLEPAARQRLEARLANMRERLAEKQAGVQAPATSPAPTVAPATTAQAPAAALSMAPAAQRERDDGGHLTDNPWLWVGVAVVTAAAIGLTVALSDEADSPDPRTTPNSLPGVALRATRRP